MGHDEDGPALPMECQQEIQDLCAAAAVQIAGRLVRQNQDGSLTSARATATRCFWPPDSSAGRCPRDP